MEIKGKHTILGKILTDLSKSLASNRRNISRLMGFSVLNSKSNKTKYACSYLSNFLDALYLQASERVCRRRRSRPSMWCVCLGLSVCQTCLCECLLFCNFHNNQRYKNFTQYTITHASPKTNILLNRMCKLNFIISNILLLDIDIFMTTFIIKYKHNQTQTNTHTNTKHSIMMCVWFQKTFYLLHQHTRKKVETLVITSTFGT